MRLPRLFTTSSFRLTLFSAALFSASALALFGVLYWAADRFMARQFDDSITAQMASLQEDGSDAAHLEARLAQRLSSPATRDYSYLLQDGIGRRLAGNLPAMAPHVGWQDLPMPEGMVSDTSDDHALRALGRRLGDGSFLLVARDIFDLDEFNDLLERTFGIGFLVTLVVGFGSGAVVSHGLLRRLEAISRTTREIMAGDLSRRIPVGARNDDFDRLSSSVNAMLDRIHELMENLRQVSNDIAHDLRTPLTRLRQRLEGARLDARTLGDYEGAVDGALVETDALLETFSALLRIAQIESGARSAAFAPTDLSALVAMIIDTYAPVAEDKGRSLSGDVAPGMTVDGDRQLLGQMLVNLVENALDHTPAGAAVAVALAPGGGGRGPVLTVADDGPGIPATEREKVFKRFCRLDVSRSTRGSGLGLNLVAAIVSLHSARIRLEDNAPGLRVVVTF